MSCARRGAAEPSATAMASTPKDIRFIEAPCCGQMLFGWHFNHGRLDRGRGRWVQRLLTRLTELLGTIGLDEADQIIHDATRSENVVRQLRVPCHGRAEWQVFGEQSGERRIDCVITAAEEGEQQPLHALPGGEYRAVRPMRFVDWPPRHE